MNTISSKILLSILLVVISFFGILGYFEIRNISNREYVQMTVEQQQIANRLAISLSDPMWNLNQRGVHQILASELVGEKVAAVVVYDETNNIYDGSVLLTGSDMMISYRSDSTGFRKTLNRLSHSANKEIFHKNTSIGKVFVFANYNPIKELISNLRSQLLFKIALLILVISVVLFVVLHRVVIRPLVHLREWVEGLQSSQDKMIVRNFGSIEFNSLHKSFVNMANQLVTTSDEIKKKNQELQTKEYELRNQNLELEQARQLLVKQNSDLLEAKNKAEESDRLKTAFLNNMSHEIRTPMNAIMGFSDLLVRFSGDVEKVESFVKIINRSSKDLLVIIDEILDIARIEAGEMHTNIDSFNVQNVFEQLIVFFQEELTRRGKSHLAFSMYMPEELKPLMFKSDEVRFKQIFINLLSNAVKFTDQGSITGGCMLDEQKRVVFYVSDTGIGIPNNRINGVFDRFTQIYSTPERLYGGTGLGLSIVKGIVELLGGSIWVESEMGKGSTFYFTISGHLSKD